MLRYKMAVTTSPKTGSRDHITACKMEAVEYDCAYLHTEGFKSTEMKVMTPSATVPVKKIRRLILAT
jgi:hypothetical protein